MMFTRHFVLMTVTAAMTFVAPCVAQDAAKTDQAAPAITGTGKPTHIAVWTSSTNLGSSGIIATSGNVGIGTGAPAAKLEVNGNAQVDGNFSLSGSILLTGVGPLMSAQNDGLFNFSAGLSSLPSTTTGASNTAVGDGALAANTTGELNTAVGTSALTSNTEGLSNTAVGSALAHNTTGNGNTAIASSALNYNTTGSDNTGVGVSALFYNVSGTGNSALGESALQDNTSGFYNIAIGFQAGINVNTTSNNIYLGNRGAATDSGTIRIGCTINCSFDPGLAPQTSAFIAGISGVNISGVPVLVNSSGQLGVTSSSRRYKEDIRDMDDASDGLMHLRPVTFRYKKAYEDGSRPIQYGLIAEEVAEVYPDLVARSVDGQVETVKYQLLDPMLLNELQKQHATITAQLEQIHEQQEQIRSLAERLARIEAALSTSVPTSSH
jgi:hypothetical protein